MKSINQWVSEIHSYAKEKGWWDAPQRTPLEIHMLVVSEVAEASECVRNGEPPIHYGTLPDSVSSMGFDFIESNNRYLLSPWEGGKQIKCEGEAVELVDAVIRIMDYFGAKGWDLEAVMEAKHAYNQKRPYRHGGKLL